MKTDLLGGMTIRARAVYFLALAERAVARMKRDAAGYKEARSALDAAWRWVGNEGIKGDSLYAYLENEDDTGLMVFGGAARHNEELASLWNVILTALLYVIWQAYQEEGEEYLPQTIEAVDESIVGDLHRHAEKAALLTKESEFGIREALLQRFPIREDAFGERIARQDAVELLS